MKRLVSFFVLFLICVMARLEAQETPTPSFFPHQVGDRWDYWHSAYGYYSTVLTRDSISTDGSRYLFYNGSAIPTFKIDTMQRVVSNPTFPTSRVLYELDADSGFVWQGGPWRWAWVARIESVWVFGRRTVSKIFRYNPGHPDTTGWDRYYEEHRLAKGFGKFYWEGEPAWVEYLVGCIVAGDTFGTLVSVAPQEGDLPKAFMLNQNYPNPFNPSTTIEFKLPEASKVSVQVYDLLGQQVATIAEGLLAAGTHRYYWSASVLSSGLYFCRLRAKGNVRTIKMLLTK